MIVLFARPHLFNVSKQLFEPTRLIARQNLVNKTNVQCFKTNRGMFRRNQVVKNKSPLFELFESRIFRASVSAIGGSLIFFGCSTIWTYERVLKYKKIQAQFPYFSRQQKNQIGPIQQIKNYWRGLKENQKAMFVIGALNVLIFCAWRIPRLEPIMYKFFTVNLQTNHTFLPMLLSTFSHQAPFHLFANLYVLNSFSSVSSMQWGKETMVALYLSAGMFGSLGSILLKVYRQSTIPSLGASAAILGLIAPTCILHPDSRISIMFLPFFSFTAQNALIGILALDVTGILLGWKLLDHAGHLGGTLFGAWFAVQGHKFFKKYGWNIAKYYNKIRRPN